MVHLWENQPTSKMSKTRPQADQVDPAAAAHPPRTWNPSGLTAKNVTGFLPIWRAGPMFKCFKFMKAIETHETHAVKNIQKSSKIIKFHGGLGFHHFPWTTQVATEAPQKASEWLSFCLRQASMALQLLEITYLAGRRVGSWGHQVTLLGLTDLLGKNHQLHSTIVRN